MYSTKIKFHLFFGFITVFIQFALNILLFININYILLNHIYHTIVCKPILLNF